MKKSSAIWLMKKIRQMQKRTKHLIEKHKELL